MKSITYGIVLQEKTVKAFEPGSIVEVSVDGVGKAIRECVDEIESLRQQLAECQANLKAEVAYSNKTDVQLAESQALEYAFREPLALCLSETDISFETRQRIKKALALPSDSTALESAISQAMREALLEAINEWEKPYGLTDGSPFIERLRRMADNLKD